MLLIYMTMMFFIHDISWLNCFNCRRWKELQNAMTQRGSELTSLQKDWTEYEHQLETATKLIGQKEVAVGKLLDDERPMDAVEKQKQIEVVHPEFVLICLSIFSTNG